MKEKIIEGLIEDRVQVLKSNKVRLEEQLTSHTEKESKELPEAFAEQRKEKLAETIKELKILETDEKPKTSPED